MEIPKYELDTVDTVNIKIVREYVIRIVKGYRPNNYKYLGIYKKKVEKEENQNE